MRLWTVTVALLGLFAATSAVAKDLRFPETGNPAVGLTLPDDWTSRVEAGKKIFATSGDGSINLSVSLLAFGGELDTLIFQTAEAAKAGEPQNAQDITLAGFEGISYYSRMNANPDMVLRIIAVNLDTTHVALVTLTMSAKIDVDKGWAAESVIRTMRFSRPVQ